MRDSTNDERGEQEDADCGQAERARRAPAERLGLDDRVDEHHQARGHQHRADDVERACALGLGLVDQAPRQDRRGGADRHVDEEDPLPAERLGEDAAEQQADCAAARGDRAPHAQRLGALRALGEGRGDDAQRGGRDERASEALQPAEHDQLAGALGEAVEQARDREHDHAGDEDLLAPDDVRGAAAEQQEAAEQQRVAVDHPLQVGLAELQVLLDRRQRDVDDRRVEDDHELGQADQDQRHPAVVFASLSHRRKVARPELELRFEPGLT